MQAIYADSGTGSPTSQSVTLPTGATAGNLLLVAASSDATLSTPTGFTIAQTAIESQGCYLWYATASGGETTFTTSPSVARAVSMAALEYSGIGATPLDRTGSATGTTTTGPAVVGPTLATSQDVELVVSVVGLHSFATPPTAPVFAGGFTAELSGGTTGATGSQNVGLFVGDLVTVTAGTQSSSVTWTNTANDWAAIIATFKGA